MNRIQLQLFCYKIEYAGLGIPVNHHPLLRIPPLPTPQHIAFPNIVFETWKSTSSSRFLSLEFSCFYIPPALLPSLPDNRFGWYIVQGSHSYMSYPSLLLALMKNFYCCKHLLLLCTWMATHLRLENQQRPRIPHPLQKMRRVLMQKWKIGQLSIIPKVFKFEVGDEDGREMCLVSVLHMATPGVLNLCKRLVGACIACTFILMNAFVKFRDIL